MLLAIGVVGLLPRTSRAQSASVSPPVSPSAVPPDAPPVAPPDANALEARSLFERGVQFAAQERWGEALDLFQRSHALIERPNTVFNEASTLVRLGRLIDAREALTVFLRISDATRDAASRADAERLIASVRSSIALLALAVSPGEAEVRIDGRLIPGTGGARSVELDPGAHTLTATLRGFVSTTVALSVGHAEHIAREVTLAPVTTTGTLTVSATPSTAAIRVDGRVVGRANYTDALAPGTHEVEIVADGYVSAHRTVAIARGENVVVHTSLAPLRGFAGSPAFWGLVVGAVVLVGGGITLGVLSTQRTFQSGSTGQLLPEP